MLFAVLIGCATPLLSGAAAHEEVKIGGVLPDAVLQGLNGLSTRLAAFRGKPLLINIWASWCGPCKAETAGLERLAWLESSRDFNVIGISTDDQPELAKAWLERSHATINQYIDTRLQMENRLGASRLPLTVFVGPDGRVLAKIYGARDWDSPAAVQLIRKIFSIGAPAQRK